MPTQRRYFGDFQKTQYMHAFVLFRFTERSFFVCSAAGCKLGKPSFYARATGILWQLNDGGPSNWVLKCRTAEQAPVSDHPQREYNYNQTRLYGRPLTSNMDTSLLRTNCFVPGKRMII